VSEPNKQLSYLQKTTFLFGTRPKQSHPNKEKRGGSWRTWEEKGIKEQHKFQRKKERIKHRYTLKLLNHIINKKIQ